MPHPTWTAYNGKSVSHVYSWVLVSTQTKQYRCKLCSAVNRLGKGPTNLVRHFATTHPTIDTTQKYVEKKTPALKLLPDIMKKNATEVYAKQSDRQRRFVNHIADWIATDLRPLTLVHDSGFKKLMKEVAPKYTMVSRATILRNLRTREVSIDAHFRVLFARVSSFAATTDVWTDECSRSYSSLTIHFIDSTWTYRSHLLACAPLKERHSAQYLASVFISLANRFNILNRLTFVCVDNASNAKAFVRLTAEELSIVLEHEEQGPTANSGNNTGSDMQHIAPTAATQSDVPIGHPSFDDVDQLLGLPLMDAYSTQSELGGNEHPASGTADVAYNRDTFNADEIFDGLQNGLLSHDDTPNASGQPVQKLQVTLHRIPCAAHTLQLCVRKALDAPVLQEAVAEIRKTCRYFRKSANGWLYLERAQKARGLFPRRLLIDVRTRWGSTFSMVTRYLSIREYVDEAVTKLYADKVSFGALKPSAALTTAQIHSLEQVCGALRDAESATALLGADKSPTMHLQDVIISRYLQELRSLITTSPPGSSGYIFGSVMVTELLQRRSKNMIECPMASVFNQVATLLTPAYRHLGHMVEVGQYENTTTDALVMVGKMAEHLSSYHGNGAQTEGPNGEEVSAGSSAAGPASSSVHHLLNAGNPSAPEGLPERTTFGGRVLEEFRLYLITANGCPGECPLLYWKTASTQFPHLGIIAGMVFTPPAASTASERVFSTAGAVRQKRRGRLTPESTELLLKVGHYLKSI